jgi:hypothetical protein
VHDVNGCYLTAFTCWLLAPVLDNLELQDFKRRLIAAILAQALAQWCLLEKHEPEAAARAREEIAPGLWLSAVLGGEGDIPFVKFDYIVTKEGDRAFWHRDGNANVPQVTSSKSSEGAEGGELVLGLGERGRDGVLELAAAPDGACLVHIVPTEKFWHRVRTLKTGERFVCCLYVPRLVMPFSAMLRAKGLTVEQALSMAR